MQAKISVIIPIYNVEKYIGTCLDSIITQSYTNIEIIIVNDYSPDNSEQIILEYQQKDSRIKYFKNDINQGLFVTRKNGFLQATGDYIINIDSDDYFFSPTILEDSIQFFSNPSVDLVAFGWNVVHEAINEQQYDYQYKLENKQLTTINEKLDDYFRANSITESLCGKIFKKEILQHVYNDIPKLNIVFQEDGITILSVFLRTRIIQLIPNIGFNYVQRPNSSTQFSHMSKEKVLKTLQDWTIASNYIRESLKENNLWARYYQQFYERNHRFYLWLYEPLKIQLTTEEYEENKHIFIEAFLPWIFLNENKWYRFGQLSPKKKIKTLITIILKKIGLCK
ncbi:MAG: glycosyltransferase family 2 protein [Brevinema sp.]